MTFPKQRMTSGELKKMGFSEWELHCLAHVEGQTYARKLPGGRKIFWDTEKLGKALSKQAVR